MRLHPQATWAKREEGEEEQGGQALVEAPHSSGPQSTAGAGLSDPAKTYKHLRGGRDAERCCFLIGQSEHGLGEGLGLLEQPSRGGGQGRCSPLVLAGHSCDQSVTPQ